MKQPSHRILEVAAMSDDTSTDDTERPKPYAFKFESCRGDTAMMISEGNESFWMDYGEIVTIVSWGTGSGRDE